MSSIQRKKRQSPSKARHLGNDEVEDRRAVKKQRSSSYQPPSDDVQAYPAAPAAPLPAKPKPVIPGHEKPGTDGFKQPTLPKPNYLKHQGTFSHDYLRMYNEIVRDIQEPGAPNGSETSELKESQLGGTIWTVQEKERCLNAIPRYGRDAHKLAKAARKTVPETTLYLNSLEHGLQKRRRAGYDADQKSIPAAIHMEPKARKAMEVTADGLAWPIFKKEMLEERRVHGDEWLIYEKPIPPRGRGALKSTRAKGNGRGVQDDLAQQNQLEDSDYEDDDFDWENGWETGPSANKAAVKQEVNDLMDLDANNGDVHGIEGSSQLYAHPPSDPNHTGPYYHMSSSPPAPIHEGTAAFNSTFRSNQLPLNSSHIHPGPQGAEQDAQQPVLLEQPPIPGTNFDDSAIDPDLLDLPDFDDVSSVALSTGWTEIGGSSRAGSPSDSSSRRELVEPDADEDNRSSVSQDDYQDPIVDMNFAQDTPEDAEERKKHFLDSTMLLHLSRTVFMNSSDSDLNWETHRNQFPGIMKELPAHMKKEKQLQAPAMFRSAFDDLARLTTTLTRKIIATAQYQAQTRMRGADRVDVAPAPYLAVTKSDIDAAVDILGLERNTFMHWAEFPLRHEAKYHIKYGHVQKDVDLPQKIAAKTLHLGPENVGGFRQIMKDWCYRHTEWGRQQAREEAEAKGLPPPVFDSDSEDDSNASSEPRADDEDGGDPVAPSDAESEDIDPADYSSSEDETLPAVEGENDTARQKINDAEDDELEALDAEQSAKENEAMIALYGHHAMTYWEDQRKKAGGWKREANRY